VGLLAACSSSSDPLPVAAAVAPAPTTFTVAGTAATGAALDGATITITGSDGKTYPVAGDPPVLTGTDGSYTITLPLTAKPPFVVTAVKNDVSLVSVVPEAKDSTTNITPVTNLIASRLSSSGDPAKLAAEIQADPTLVDLAKVTAKVAEVVALIKPVMDAVGDSTNPLTGNIQAAVTAGTGADKVLDSLSITITPNSANTVNIEVAVKQKQADESAQPATVTFTGGANATAPAATLPTVAAADLAPDNNAALIADLLQRIQACYAVPLADRITAGGTTAADIVAPACRTIFSADDPANYKNSGAVVSKTGAWGSIFTGENLPSTAGIRFDSGSYQFTRASGDLVIRFRSLSSQDAVSYSTAVVRNEGGKLKLIGNQYKYNGSVNAYHQLRTFIAQPAADYYSTGYTLNVNATADVTNIGKVVVTSPKGNTLLLKPSAGSAYFPLVKVNGATETVTGTNFLRLERAYVDTANSGDPALADTSNFFSTTRYTNADIIAIPAQAKWKFEYFLKTNTTTTPDETQYFTTVARAMTIPELQTQSLAKFADADVADAKSQLVTVGSNTWLPVPATGPVDPAWDVPTGALAPTNVQVYGNYVTSPTTRASFNDKTGVRSIDRSAKVFCSSAGTGDTHCDSTGNFTASDHLTGIHLWASDAAGREFAHFYAFTTVVIP
jgi:hypothetical protein